MQETPQSTPEATNARPHRTRISTQADFDEEHGYAERPRPSLIAAMQRQVRET